MVAKTHCRSVRACRARSSVPHRLQLQLGLELVVHQREVVLADLLPRGRLKVNVRSTLELLRLGDGFGARSTREPLSEFLVESPLAVVPVASRRAT